MKDYNISVVNNPNSRISEAYKTLRTNIQFSSFDNIVKTIVLTSAVPGEGKTTTAINLAASIAQAGKKTILIDCDIRNPNIHKAFGLSNEIGISDLLIGAAQYDEVIRETDIHELYILTSGTRLPNPAELVASLKMQGLVKKLKECFDYVLIDTPPILMVTDAQIISKYADGSILVVASGQSEKDSVIRAKELLEKINAKILGVVLNKVEVSKKGYYGSYYKYYSDKRGRKKKKGIHK